MITYRVGWTMRLEMRLIFASGYNQSGIQNFQSWIFEDITYSSGWRLKMEYISHPTLMTFTRSRRIIRNKAIHKRTIFQMFHCIQEIFWSKFLQRFTHSRQSYLHQQAWNKSWAIDALVRGTQLSFTGDLWKTRSLKACYINPFLPQQNCFHLLCAKIFTKEQAAFPFFSTFLFRHLCYHLSSDKMRIVSIHEK